MIFALGAASSIWDVLQSSFAAQSGTTSQTTATSFEPTSDVSPPESTATACSSGNCSSPLSSQTLGALIAAQSPSAANPSTSLPSGPKNTIQQLAASLVAEGNGQIGQLPEFLTGAAGHFNLAGITGTDPTGGTGSSVPSGGVGGTTDTGGSGTDPQGQVAGASTAPTTVTNGDGSTTTSFTWPDGTKVTVTTPAPSTPATSVAWPSNLASLSYSQIEQRIQSEAQSLSAFAPFSINS